MSGYTYAARRRTETPSKQERETGRQAPPIDALRSWTAAPTQELLGSRVDLPGAIQAKMENAFGADLSGVQFYESQAVAAAGAEAITQGNKIGFAPGKLDFVSQSGQALLGHELSHVVSQARGEVSSSGFLNDHALEARADREGAMAAAGEQVWSGPVTGSLSSTSAAPAAGPMQAKKSEREAPPLVPRSEEISDHFDFGIDDSDNNVSPPQLMSPPQGGDALGNNPITPVRAVPPGGPSPLIPEEDDIQGYSMRTIQHYAPPEDTTSRWSQLAGMTEDFFHAQRQGTPEERSERLEQSRSGLDARGQRLRYRLAGKFLGSKFFRKHVLDNPVFMGQTTADLKAAHARQSKGGLAGQFWTRAFQLTHRFAPDQRIDFTPEDLAQHRNLSKAAALHSERLSTENLARRFRSS